MDNSFITNHRELRVYESALDYAMQIYQLTREFPKEERDRFTLPMIQSARLVCIYIAEAWQRRRYHSAFVAKLNQAETTVATTQVWVEFAVLCNYIDAEVGQELYHQYRGILGELSRLIAHANVWVIPSPPNR